ncbi:MAG TPA: hypothetical protein DCY48_02095 [Candidatus Magasanikbacteria bacterium]|nr:MAG: hypothetical protein A3I74_01005 [Candidatus Magasanikbacteria bacterium RIFCSPLOWO2_02_FULL_47_16]OGH79977.1 MAG: hypothetical protein A3C10_02220 [Candidatus Magasanikbacteria bacterium RIFCSPHIGHO2_02_FULL_48_18]OGH82989.1 MAG: hypothetical protein A3G08_03705 [Candidatus Magasanikbacteria bacterium RIFCSPLOWO2_12_FULL_47_9b]HAZ28547.1 hypothetical protein [Candidatus Magasanikbacteria bacterium]
MKRPFLLFFTFVCLGIIGFFWWRNSGVLLLDAGARADGMGFIVFGRLFGLLAVFCILVQLLLIGRIKWIENTIGFDKLAHLHHLNGFLALFFILLHPFFIIFGYKGLSDSSFVHQFFTLLSLDDVLGAVIGFVLFALVVTFSIVAVAKRLRYEVWYGIHVSVYAAILFSYGHQLELGGDFLSQPFFVLFWYALYAFVFTNFVVFRFIMPVWRYAKHRFVVDLIVKEADGAHSVYITAKHLDAWKAKPGQFIIVRFFQKGFWWEAHPFSLSSPVKGSIRITAKALGDFTKKIPSLSSGTKVLIDGPHGGFTPNEKTKKKVLLVAGGIGVTPLRTISEELLQKGYDVAFVYSTKVKEESVFNQEFIKLQEQFTQQFHFVPVYTRGEPAQKIDETFFMNFVDDLKEREAFICGPKPMIESIALMLERLGLSKKDIHFEKFSFS